MATELLLPDLAATAALGRALGRLARNGDVILLHGGLGAGKTTLTQAVAVGLEVPPDQYVSSPSFALLHEYQGRLPLFHLDCYRLAGEEDVEGAGLLDYIGSSGLTVIEWPDRLGSLCPPQRLDITLEAAGETERRCLLEPQGAEWQERMALLTGSVPG
jgi:tRNA threonylcarbamoyladenosine biosynthesis protein TsaE